MRICLLGEFRGDLDEAMRKSSYYYETELKKSHEVLALDLRDVRMGSFWKRLKAFRPEIVHYVHGPTINSLILLKIVSTYSGHPKTVASSMRPRFSRISRQLIPLFKPDLSLSQSESTERMLTKYGCRTMFLPGGVDISRFKLISPEDKSMLRDRLGIARDKFIVLHVGSVKEGRNVKVLKALQSDDVQVLIIAALSPGVDTSVMEDLRQSGCIIKTEYFPAIEDVYSVADCYVYPVIDREDHDGRKDSDSIELPLTVIEAMASGLPVVATRFGALPRIFTEGEGLLYADTEEDIKAAVDLIRNHMIPINTREKVLQLSWEAIANRLSDIYGDLLDHHQETRRVINWQ